MTIPNAKYTVGDKVFITLLEGGEDERRAEGIIYSVRASEDYGVPELWYEVFVLDEDKVYGDFEEDDLTERA